MCKTNNPAAPIAANLQPTVAPAANNDLLQIEEYLSQHYLFRNNVLNGKYEVANLPDLRGEKADEKLYFSSLTPERWNSIIWDMQMSLPDVRSVAKSAEILVHSDHTPTFDPIEDYIHKLPEWDGEDHVGRLIRCLPRRQRLSGGMDPHMASLHGRSLDEDGRRVQQRCRSSPHWCSGLR